MQTLVIVIVLWSACLLSPLLFWGADRVRSARAARRLPPPREVTGRVGRDLPDLVSLAADLSRLEATFRRIDADNPPAKMQRLHAVGMAYDDVLCECYQAMGLAPPTRRPLSADERITAESELALRGVLW